MCSKQRIMIFPTFAFMVFFYFHSFPKSSTVHGEPEALNIVKEQIISCVGDSITNGSNSKSSYPAVLRKQFREHRFTVHNFGSNGQTALKDSDHSYWSEPEYRKAMNSTPHIVVLQFGTNDARATNWNESLFRLDYINMIERFQSLPSQPVIFLCIPPPIYCPKKNTKSKNSNDCWKHAERAKVVNNDLPRIISDISFYTGSILVDNFELLGGKKLTKPELFYEREKVEEDKWTNKYPFDGIHPNDHGNNLIGLNVAWKIVDHFKRSSKVSKFYDHLVSQIIYESENERDGSAVNITRNKLKRDSVYSHIYNHMKNNPKINDTNLPIRPVISCIGVSGMM